MEQPSTSGARSEEFLRNVFLLKNGDFEVINGQIHVPTKSEISTIRARTDQYKKDVEFNASMSSNMVKKKLEETFPYLKDKGFFCAAKRNVDNDAARFDFDGSPHRWNGRTIKKKIQGNSALFILENDQMDTSSGISASDSESSQDATGIISLLQGDLHLVECNPAYSPLQGGGPCVFTFIPELHSEVTSVYATFEGLGTQKLEFLKLGFFPASQDAKVVTVKLTSQDGVILGYTEVTYVLTKEQQVVSFPRAMREFFDDLLSGNPFGNPSGNSGGETESLRSFGCKTPAQVLSLLVYVAAEIGAQQFIEIIFTSSARRVVHNAYKRNLTLPETVARDHGYIETANYLADVTKRFSEETTSDDECSLTIDWSELVKAAEAAEKQLDLTNEKQNGQVKTNDSKETGYLADADTSSSEASAPQSSDSEDDILNKTKTTTTATVAAAAAAAAADADTSSSKASVPQSSDSEDDISNNTKTTATAAAMAKATAAATTTTTETRKGSVSGRECQIGLQREVHREDGNAGTGDPIAGNYKSRKETLHQFESKRGKKGAIWQQGDLHRKYCNRDTEDAITGNYRGRIGTSHQFESKSGKKGEIWQQGNLLPKDPNRDTGNPVAGNYLDRKETSHQFESRRGKTGEIWQQGDLHRSERHRDTGESNPSNYLDRKETLHQFEYNSVKTGEISPQGDLHRKDRSRDTVDVIAGKCRKYKEIVHEIVLHIKSYAAESDSGKTGEIWPQGDLHRKARSRDTEDSVADSYRDGEETVLEFGEVEDIRSTSDFMKEVRRVKNNLPKSKTFKALPKAKKQQDSKDFKRFKEKTEKLMSKAQDTINSLRTAANRLDEVWKESKKIQAAGTAGGIAGGLLTIAGGVATAMTLGAATPLLIAGMSISVAGAGTNLWTNLKEASINSSEIEEADKKLKDTKDSISDVQDTIQFWLKTKEDLRLLYICCLAELNQEKNDAVNNLLQILLLSSLMLSVKVLGAGRTALSSGMLLADVTLQGLMKTAMSSGLANGGVKAATSGLANGGVKAATSGLADGGAKAAGQVASNVMIGVTAALVAWNAIDLGYTIKDIVEDKGSEAARCLRQKADELESAFPESRKNYFLRDFGFSDS